jgi:hypothetical protein
LKWLGILLVLLAGWGFSSYYCHLYLEDDGGDQPDSATSVGQVMRPPGQAPPVANVHAAVIR